MFRKLRSHMNKNYTPLSIHDPLNFICFEVCAVVLRTDQFPWLQSWAFLLSDFAEFLKVLW